jgi:hypothetical protein
VLVIVFKIGISARKTSSLLCPNEDHLLNNFNIMKNVILLLLLIAITLPSLAQKTEAFLSVNSGLFSFQGVSAEKTSQINLYSDNIGYTNNPFGAEKGFSYGLSYQIQYLSKNNFIAGISLGYENLRSKTTLNTVNGFDGKTTFQVAASGRSNLSHHFINGFPYVGYRLVNKPIAVDLTGGFDIGYLLKSFESGQAIGTNGVNYKSALERTSIKLDLRPRVQLSAGYAKLGLYVGYAYGLKNYRSGWVGGPNQCNSELIRFGIMYKLQG